MVSMFPMKKPMTARATTNGARLVHDGIKAKVAAIKKTDTNRTRCFGNLSDIKTIQSSRPSILGSQAKSSFRPPRANNHRLEIHKIRASSLINICRIFVECQVMIIQLATERVPLVVKWPIPGSQPSTGCWSDQDEQRLAEEDPAHGSEGISGATALADHGNKKSKDDGNHWDDKWVWELSSWL